MESLLACAYNHQVLLIPRTGRNLGRFLALELIAPYQYFLEADEVNSDWGNKRHTITDMWSLTHHGTDKTYDFEQFFPAGYRWIHCVKANDW
jgi:hypothetical protein